MKTSEQIKGAIRNISKKTGVNPNSLLQMCLFEGILEKISKSKYRENFILKGGLLISSLIGVDVRSTMDMDTTLRGIPLNEVSITNILNEILAIEIDADIEYKLIKLSPIRQEDVYEDFCASISCIFGKINTSLNIDITTGDVITPREMNYSYSKILEEGTIPIMTYTIETILAEKFETISSRNITTTRARDFYDLYMLYGIYKDKIDKDTLQKAIERTSKYRGSFETVLQYREIVDLFRESEMPKELWEKYKKNSLYMPFGADTNFFYPREKIAKFNFDCSYVGSDIKGEKATMKYLYPAVDFNFGLFGNWKINRHRFMIWKNFTKKPPYKKVFDKLSLGKIKQEDIPYLYSSSKINLNCTLQDCIDWDVVTLRTYEVLACKGFLITDIVPSAFKTMQECMVFTSGGDDLREKIRYYLSNDAKREEIAQNGYEYVVKNASIDARVKELITYIKGVVD